MRLDLVLYGGVGALRAKTSGPDPRSLHLMSDANTVRKRVKPITVRCGAPGCNRTDDAIASYGSDADASFEVVAPRGWTFRKPPQLVGQDVYGSCPTHSNAKS